ncbi:ABC transporter permease [Chitinibacter bivalviorum]|uniref:ABC transporter permease n=1 Tax=Chitinibacter bivalviorum TaxID=2739434 RepID=A0A7H9BLV1_9NEIS|nr:ABC transporter permease [Chitinibacter bivalviorum]QLG89657.1 ABC transporter permease [Chitinibacter bivalviorum]
MIVSLKEIFAALRQYKLIWFFAWGDVLARYKRSALGPWWITISTALGVLCLGIIWGALLKSDGANIFPILAIGLVLWQFISGCLVEASSVFTRQGNVIRNMPVPFAIFPFQLVAKRLIDMAHNSLVVVVVLVFFSSGLSWVALLAIPGLILAVANMIWIVMLIGLVGARYRDVEPLINAFLPMLFFITPVMYRTSHLGHLEFVAMLNPLSHFINLVREPLLNVVPTAQAYIVALLVLMFGFLITLWVYKISRQNLAFWM